MQLLEMIRKIRSGQRGREEVARMLYTDIQLQNGIKKILYKIGVGEDEFTDVFNFTIVQFMKTAMKNSDFNINTNLNSYLFGIARNICLQKQRKKKILTTDLSDKINLTDNEKLVDLKIIHSEKKDLLHKVLNQLGIKCREVLMYWASGYKMAEIAKLLNYASDVVVRRKKMNCMQELLKFLDKNTHIKTMLS